MGKVPMEIFLGIWFGCDEILKMIIRIMMKDKTEWQTKYKKFLQE